MRRARETVGLAEKAAAFRKPERALLPEADNGQEVRPGAVGQAAGMLFVTEAGGVVSNADGGSDPLATGTICVANTDLHPQVLARLKAAA